MKPKVLMVEDELDAYSRVVDMLNEISPDDKKHHGIDGFLFLPSDRPATSASQAVALLKEASANGTPYDILILDLQIPKDNGPLGIPTTRKIGLDVLSIARDLGAAREIIIYTRFTEYENVLEALRGGAIDFVSKESEDNKELSTRVLGCWQRILARVSAALLEQRIKDLVPYAEAGLAHRFTACFSDFAQTVAHNADDIGHYAYERFGLDLEKDSQDFLIRCLKKQESELKAAMENWVKLNADLTVDDEVPGTSTVEVVLNSIEEKLAPCLRIKNTSLKMTLDAPAAMPVLTFKDDVYAISQEIIAGALCTLPDYGDEQTIEISSVYQNGQAEIRFSDYVKESISPEDAAAINGGFTVGPDHEPNRFGRAWGLSVVQLIALRGGGRLIVKPQSTMPGNIITYFVPLSE